MFGTLWLRLHRKWRYASTSIEYRASQILYLLLSPLLLLFDADMLFCFNHRDILPEMNMSTTEKKPNKSEIFNANMVQPNTKSAIVFEEKKQKLCCIRCEMRLKISHITDFVNCLNGGLLVFCASSLTHTLLQPFNDDKYIFTLYDDGKSKPTEKKCQPFLFRLPLNPFTH